jgi:hypothetical protein
VPARVVEASDIEAQYIAAAENFLREGYTAVESVEVIVQLVDTQLIEDKQYASMGKEPADRVKALLGKIKSVMRSKERGYNVSKELRQTSNKFIRRVDQIFKNLPN